MVRLIAQGYSFPKDPTAPHECEDSVACSVRSGRFAVADGASQSYRSGDWAEQLTQAYLTSFPAPATFAAAGGPVSPQRLTLIQEWFGEQVRLWHERAPAAANWWDKDAAVSRPPSATFAGLHLASNKPDKRTGCFEVSAFGDCCLFQLRRGRLELVFPLSSTAQFNKHPDLLTTAHGRLEGSLGALRVRTGQAFPGDVFLLATDAASELLLGLAEHHPERAGQLGFLGSKHFEALMTELRQAGGIERDDVAVAVIAVLP